MSSTGGTSCGLIDANRVGNCCTAVLNGGLMALTERLHLPNLHNFLWPCFSTHRSFLSWPRWIRSAFSYHVDFISFSVFISPLPVSSLQIYSVP